MAVENAQLPVIGSQNRGQTERHDLWWVQPLVTCLVLLGFVVYATWRTFENRYYETFSLAGLLNYDYWPQYLSPFYSPTLGKNLSIGGINISPALWILPFPLFFRLTCYYYRKAYYRAFFWDPPACAVSEGRHKPGYTGEREFPFVLQNLHRYAFYLAVIVLAILWWDAFLAFRYVSVADNTLHYFVGLGSLIFLVNVVLLTLYTFSCHSWRHLLGGCIDCFSCSGSTRVRHTIWERVSHLNESHGLWAWCSLVWVALTDLYVRQVAIGAIHDFRLLG